MHLPLGDLTDTFYGLVLGPRSGAVVHSVTRANMSVTDAV